MDLREITTRDSIVRYTANSYTISLTDQKHPNELSQHLTNTTLRVFILPLIFKINPVEIAAITVKLWKKFTLFSDSQTALRRLEKRIHHCSELDALITEVLATLDSPYQSNIEITFVWIPTYSGTSSHDVVNATLPLLNPSGLKDHLYYLVQNLWNMEWSLTAGKLWSIKPDVRNRTPFIGKSRGSSRTLETSSERLPLGHTSFSPIPPICSTCNDLLIGLHIINNCRLYCCHRHEFGDFCIEMILGSKRLTSIHWCKTQLRDHSLTAIGFPLI